MWLATFYLVKIIFLWPRVGSSDHPRFTMHLESVFCVGLKIWMFLFWTIVGLECRLLNTPLGTLCINKNSDEYADE